MHLRPLCVSVVMLAALAAPLAAHSAVQVWAGGDNTCALVNGAAFCWGANTDGQVGNGTFSMATSPSPVQGLSTGVQAIVTSGAHSCAIRSGAAYCWGNNDYGQLGNGGGTDSPAPVAVTGLGSGVTAIAVGDLHSCAVHNGAAKCWGSGGFGQLGTGGSIFSSSTPVAVAGLGSGIVDINTGKHHSCALTGAGASFCWGRGDSGERGDGTNTYIVQGPVAVTGYGSGVTQVTTGAFFTCGIRNGAAQCWGYGINGRLGNGGTSNTNVPGAVSGLVNSVEWISAGNGLHACALVGGSGALCWGGNNAGQLGNAGFPGGSTVPVAVQGLPGDVVDITAGGLHTCAATEAAIYCWGSNANGQLGTGNQTASGTPVFVMDVPAAPPPPANPPRLINISTRMQVLTGNDVMIGGFVIGGSQPKTVVVRARGPSLIPFGITNALADPMMVLVRSSDQATVGSNDDWQDAANAGDLSASGFAPSSNLESALLVTLNPGAYTAVVGGYNNGTGVGIVEVFEVDAPEAPLVNISTRGQVLTGNDVMIGGFVIQGDGPQTVVVRARGPSLVPFGITNALADPQLQLVRGSDQATLAINDDWQSASNAADITASGFAPSNGLEAAILVTLQPGAYTVIVSGVGGGTGVGIVEVFAP